MISHEAIRHQVAESLYCLRLRRWGICDKARAHKREANAGSRTDGLGWSGLGYQVDFEMHQRESECCTTYYGRRMGVPTSIEAVML
jgi:hypothetical protein